MRHVATDSNTVDRPWVDLYPPTADPDLVGGYTSMLEAWDQHVRTRPDAPSVFYFDRTLTFAEVDAAAVALAGTLAGHGIGHDERVAVYLQNDPQWLIAVLASWKLGAVPVAVNPMLRAEELRHILTDSGASALVCLDSLHEVVAEVSDGSDLRVVITTNPVDATPGVEVPEAIAQHFAAPQSFPGAVSWVEAMSTTATDLPEAPPQEVACLTYTSGTTGRSKGAMNTHAGVVHSSTVYSRWWDLQPEQDVIMGLAPVFHITGLVAGLGIHIISGAPLVLMHRFDGEETLRTIEHRRGTFMIGASTAFIALTNHPSLAEFDVSSLTKTPSGGAPVAQSLVDRVHAATGWTLRGAYGMTETTSPTHLGPPEATPPTDPDTGALAVGVPVPGARVRIVDPSTGRDVASGEPGEIVVSGPMVVPGYWGLPEESAHAIRDGWLHTGDLGKTTPEGWLFVIDRMKDLINAGGYKVVPRDVEDVLYSHPSVREACVVGVPDEYRGETVRAFVSLVEGATTTTDELMGFCRERMAAYKYPRSVVLLDELPKNASGKLLRRELRDG